MEMVKAIGLKKYYVTDRVLIEINLPSGLLEVC